MTRARSVFAATLVGASLVAGTALAQATPPAAAPATAPPLTPILAGKKLTPPLRGQAEVEFTQPASKRTGDTVVTTIQVKNISTGPIARLTVDETWYDGVGATGNVVAGGKGVINGLLQPGEIGTVRIETSFNAKMKASNWNFSHANGAVKPHRVAKLTAGDEKAPAAAAPKAAPPAKK
jgi:hypothetical protein